MTSIKSFPKDICRHLETLTEGLEFLEIGDCDCLSKDFAVPLRRLVNLTSLRLENCSGRWDNFAAEVFRAIRGLENLKILELINIDFTSSVENELEKCYHIKALLIIPAYVSQVCILFLVYNNLIHKIYIKLLLLLYFIVCNYQLSFTRLS